MLNINSALHANRGPDFWKFNASLLEDSCFVNHVRENLKNLEGKYKDLEDKHLKWDSIKCELRGIIIKYSKLKARKTREREKELNKKLESQTQLIASQPSPERLEEYQNLKNELEEIYNNKTKGVMLRSHAIWCEEGEKSTKYFISLEKTNYKNKRIAKLVINNITLTDIETIIQEEKEYYQSLYKSSQKNVLSNEEFSNFLNNLDVPRLSDNEAMECEGAITETECSKILSDFKLNKTPGSDGFQVEFYNLFWSDIKDLVLESINYSVVKNRMSNDQRKGVITLVQKRIKTEQI